MTNGRRRLPAELRERAVAHVERLARRHGAQVTFSSRACYYDHKGIDAVVDKDTRRITGPVISSALEYLGHLHELGHLVSRHRSDTDEVVDEGAAWAWAAKNADPEIMRHMSTAAWAKVGTAFVTYVAHHAVRRT